MAAFLARVDIDNELALERIDEVGTFWNILLDAIKKERSRGSVEMYLYRLTFASYRIEAENRAECRKAVEKALPEVFEDTSRVTGITIVRVDGSPELEKEIKSTYDTFYGVGDYLKAIAELIDVVPVLRERNALKSLMLRNYLIAVDRGYGFTSMVARTGCLLKALGAFEGVDGVNDKDGSEKESPASSDGDGIRDRYLDLRIGSETNNEYISVDDVFEKLDTYREEKDLSIVGLDISYFLEASKKQELRDFLNCLYDYRNDYIFAFRVPFLEKRALDDITELLSDQMLLKVIQVPPICESALIESLWNTITDTRYLPNSNIRDKVLEMIAAEKSDGRFYGFKTMEKIGHSIIMKKAAEEAEDIEENGEEAHDRNAWVSIGGDDIAPLSDNVKKPGGGYEELGELIGMEEITARIKEIIAQVKISMSNEKLDRPCIHMRFTGAPGTGKTTVARIIGRIMREEGILRKGGFFEYTGRDLVAEYVGQTAVKTATICRDSYGSVLFIDEAYSLYEEDSSKNDFGKEALATLVSEMENHRDDMLVVMAGYTEEMDKLMKGNPGLRSRMPYVLNFPNYTREQLYRIFMLMVRKHFEYVPELDTAARKYFFDLSSGYLESREFANARFVRNLYERTWSKAALRASLSGRKDMILTKEDFIAATQEKEFSEKIEQKNTIGF